jgi:hypothetical protein
MALIQRCVPPNPSTHLISSWSWLYSCHSRPRRRATRRREASPPGAGGPSLLLLLLLASAPAGTSAAFSQALKAASCLSIHLRIGRQISRQAGRQ